ncbi:hypothetical protein AB7952_00185 [Streptomyces sp. PG2]
MLAQEPLLVGDVEAAVAVGRVEFVDGDVRQVPHRFGQTCGDTGGGRIRVGDHDQGAGEGSVEVAGRTSGGGIGGSSFGCVGAWVRGCVGARVRGCVGAWV